MIAEGDHDIEKFFERNETTAMFDFVVVNRVSEFSNLRPQRSITVAELTTFHPAGILIVRSRATVNEGRRSRCKKVGVSHFRMP